MNERRLLVTGCGRCGTEFMSVLLCRLGISSQHEGVFNPQPHKPHGVAHWLTTDYVAESSWLGAPEIGNLPPRFSVLHLVRNPLDSIRSFVGIKFFSEEELTRNTYTQFAKRFCPAAFEPVHEVERALTFWVMWNREVIEEATRAKSLNYERQRIELINPNELSVFLKNALDIDIAPEQIQTAITEVGTSINHRDRDGDIQWDAIPNGTIKQSAIELVNRYGFSCV
jgi:hypothetical protein